MPNAKYFKYDEEYNLIPIYDDNVVEVVRCKDCKYHKGLNCPIMKHKFTHDADYCSYGERREGK